MKNKGKLLLVGTVMFGIGGYAGFQACKKTIMAMVNDKEWMEEKIIPKVHAVLEKNIGKEKLERMIAIYNEK